MIIQIKKTGESEKYDTIQKAINDSNIGDLVVLYPSIYYEDVTLKNGVALFCLPNAVISGSSLDGTLNDGENKVETIVDGRVSLYNSNGNKYNTVFKNGHTKVEMYNVFNSGINLNGSLNVPRKGNLTLASKNGTVWKITINNDGILSTDLV